jgi:hypothetical protein
LDDFSLENKIEDFEEGKVENEEEFEECNFFSAT